MDWRYTSIKTFKFDVCYLLNEFKYLSNAYYVPDTVLGTWDIVVYKPGKNACFVEPFGQITSALVGLFAFLECGFYCAHFMVID